MENNSSYVFISYAHKDAAAVYPCIEAMKQGGVNLWFDEGIEAGSEWPEFIAEKVMYCEKFVLFISRAYLESQNCKRELNFAISRKKDILSIFLEDVSLSPGMEMQLGTYQAIYRKRFDSDEQFYLSLSREHFFNVCRVGEAVTDAPIPPTPAVPKPVPTPYNTQQGNDYQAQGQSIGVATATAYSTPYPVALPQKNRAVALILTFLFGWCGIHKFYLRQPKRGILYLIFSFTYVPLILSMVEFISLIVSSQDRLVKKYKCYFN